MKTHLLFKYTFALIGIMLMFLMAHIFRDVPQSGGLVGLGGIGMLGIIVALFFEEWEE